MHTASPGVEATCRGWLCVGFSAAFGGVHSAGDHVCAYLNASGSPIIIDATSTSTGWPKTDTQDNLLSRSGPVQVDASTRQFMFSRKLVTADAADVTFRPGQLLSIGIAFRATDDNIALKHSVASTKNIALAPLPGIFQPSDFARKEVFVNGNATLYWTIVGDTIHVGVEATCTGWLGVVFGQPHISVLSDPIVAYKTANGTGVVGDYHATSTGFPPLDAVDNLLTRFGPVQATPTLRQFMFSRLLDTGDPEVLVSPFLRFSF